MNPRDIALDTAIAAQESQRLEIAQLTRDRNELRAAISQASAAMLRMVERCRVAERAADSLAFVINQMGELEPNELGVYREYLESLKARKA